MSVTSRPRRPGPVVRTRVEELTATGSRTREDRLATEEPLEIRLEWPGSPATRVWVTMRTPGHDFELAAGYLLHEGVLGPGHLHRVAYCTDADLTPEQELNVVTVSLDTAPDNPPAGRHSAVSAGSSACGVCGKDSLAAALATACGPRWDGGLPDPGTIRRLPAALRAAQTVFARTGGVHAAGLADAAGDLLVVREDIGRHNAVDKVTGARLLAGQPTAEAVLVVSGRAGFELVQKAAAAGVGALAAVGAPSGLAVRLARESGLGLFGFVSADRCVRYS